jgi:drug/metabolite transporter (DMT)-like permease
MIGVLLGSLLFASFMSQTLGLQYTSPTRSGFITGLSVVLVPLIGLGFGQRPPRWAVVGVGLAVLGLAFLAWGCRIPGLGCAVSAETRANERLGDLLTLGCAIAFALYIFAVSRWSTTLPVLTLNAVQLIVVALLASGTALIYEWPLPTPTPGVWGAALFLGVIATAWVFALQLKVQRHTTATHTALIFALEPIFAALFAWLWIGETMTAALWIGGGLMLLGVIVAEVGPSRGRAAERLPQVRADDPMLDRA